MCRRVLRLVGLLVLGYLLGVSGGCLFVADLLFCLLISFCVAPIVGLGGQAESDLILM